MLKLNEKQKVKDVLTQLNLRKDINMAFFLNKIIDISEKVDKIIISEDSTSAIIRNQRILDDKLDKILQKIG